MTTPKISMMGDQGLLIDSGERFSLELQRKFWALRDVISIWPETQECVLGMCNMLVRLDIAPSKLPYFQNRLIEAYLACAPSAYIGGCIDIPVTYGGRLGPDLDDFAQACGLSVSDVVDLHTGTEYTVCAIGSSPGFGYLGGLPKRLHQPRKSVPILFAEAGSVMIGGDQTGVTAAGGPTGWHVIGHSQFSAFDSSLVPPARMAPGDVVSFSAIGIDDD